jgi:hypothetical protein
MNIRLHLPYLLYRTWANRINNPSPEKVCHIKFYGTIISLTIGVCHYYNIFTIHP